MIPKTNQRYDQCCESRIKSTIVRENETINSAALISFRSSELRRFKDDNEKIVFPNREKRKKHKRKKEENNTINILRRLFISRKNINTIMLENNNALREEYYQKSITCSKSKDAEKWTGVEVRYFTATLYK